MSAGRVLGVVLAGGRSSRFGSDKAAALLDGRPLAEHARILLVPYVSQAIVAERNGPIPDLPGPDLGPLGGIAGALAHGEALGFASVLTIACDVPRLPDGLLADLVSDAPVYCPQAPVVGHWPVSALPHLLDHMAHAPNRSVRGWADAIGARSVDASTPIANVNTPQDLPMS